MQSVSECFNDDARAALRRDRRWASAEELEVRLTVSLSAGQGGKGIQAHTVITR